MSAIVAFIMAARVGDINTVYRLKNLADFDSVASAAVEAANAGGHAQVAAAIRDNFMF